MKEIRVKLLDIPRDGSLVIEDVFPKGDIGVTDEDIIRVDGPVKIRAKVSVVDQILLVDAHFDGVCSSECARCLKEVHQPFHQHTLIDFDVTEAKDAIDIAEDIRQEIVADLPLQLLCKEDCKGLCLVCGANLNETTCEHQS